MFKGGPMHMRKPAGKLQEEQDNLQRMQTNIRKTTDKYFSEVKKFNSTSKVKPQGQRPANSVNKTA